MKPRTRKGLSLIAVTGSIGGIGVGLAPSASAIIWAPNGSGPQALLNVQGSVSGSGAAAVLTVSTSNTGSTGYTNTTDFGDGTASVTTSTANHSYAAGALKQTLTETATSGSGVLAQTSTFEVNVDATGGTVVTTAALPVNLAAPGAEANANGNSFFDLTKILPASAVMSGVSGTCDNSAGALALAIDTATQRATCSWPAATATQFHFVTIAYKDPTTGLKSSAMAVVIQPIEPVTAFKAVQLLSPPMTVRVDVTGTNMDTGGNIGHGTLDWGDGSTSTVAYPTYGADIFDHAYATPGQKTITFAIVDRFGNSSTTTQQIDVVPATPVANAQLTRYEGNTRYGTGVAVSRAAFPTAGSAQAVIVARGDVFADALSGIPLAKYKNGPLLLTPGGPAATTLDPNVEAEIKRVLPQDKNHTVYILGGIAAVPQQIQDYISNTLGYTVVRLAGANRDQTALVVATDPRAMNNPRHTVVARGDDFADALAAGPFAADKYTDSTGEPAAIVLSSGVGRAAALDPATAAYVSDKLAQAADNNQPNVAAIGGGAVAAVTTTAHGAKFTAISGLDRFDTAAKVAAAGWGVPGTPGIVASGYGIASGMNFPDALTGGAYMALTNGPLLLSSPYAANPALSPAALNIVTADEASLTKGSIFGGTSVLSDTTAQAVLVGDGLPAGTLAGNVLTAPNYTIDHVAF